MIVVERQVRAEPATLWDYVGRVADWADLLPTVDRVSPLSEGPAPGVGSRYAVEQPRLPRLVYEITEWEAGQRFTWVATAPGVRTVGTHEVGPAGEGSLLRLRLRWEGLLRPLVKRLFARLTQDYVEREAEAFARLAEAARP